MYTIKEMLMPNDFKMLIISILGSVIAVYIVALINSIKKKLQIVEETNKNLIELTKNIKEDNEELKVLLQKTYANQKSAEPQIIKDIENSKTLRVYAMCGSTFSDTRKNIAKTVYNDKNLIQKYLISSENNPKIKERQEELPKGPLLNLLETRIKNSINEFEAARKENRKLEYRLHDKKVGFRLIILDNCLYLSQQENNKYGEDSEMQRIPHNTPAYINFSDYFNELWDKYPPQQT